MTAVAKIEVDGVEYAETAVAVQPRLLGRAESGSITDTPERQAFIARLENWRKVVHGSVRGGAASQYCAGWAKLYVRLRTSAAMPASDALDERIKPLDQRVSKDELDAWLVEAAWRMLGDYNERQALKSLYVHRWPADSIRRFLRGVRGPHVRLVIAKAEKNLQQILSSLGDPGDASSVANSNARRLATARVHRLVRAEPTDAAL